MRITPSRRFSLHWAGSFFVLVVAIVATVAFVQPSGADERPRATEFFSIFAAATTNDAQTVTELAAHQASTRGNLAELKVIARGLGDLDSRLVAFPANEARNVCYHLLGATSADPAMGYCFSPANPYASREVADEHFSVVALESATDGEVRVQLFGMAFDDVAAVRVNISGEWKAVPLARNGFYLDLPGVRHEQVGIVDVTLEDGSSQRHDIQTGSRVPVPRIQLGGG